MKFRYLCSLTVALAVSGPVVFAGVLTSARLTEIRNDVRYQPADATERAAQMSDLVRETDVLRTGERSLAELEFNDKTITRLGSLSVFSFNRQTREFRAGKGTMLICVPKGAGGGRIVTSAITAAIQGTTVVTRESVVTGTNGQPRVLSTVIFLEGSGFVYRTGDPSRTGVPIGAGQMVAQFSDTRGLAPVRHVDVRALLNHARILHGFTAPLPSLPIIETVVSQQQTDLQRGDLQPTAPPPTGGGGTTPDGGTTGGGTSGENGSPPAMPPTPTTEQIFDTPQQAQPVRPVIYSVGGGFYLSTLPIPGYNSAPLEGGGYICRPRH